MPPLKPMPIPTDEEFIKAWKEHQGKVIFPTDEELQDEQES
jgi:hypothetical protein